MKAQETEPHKYQKKKKKINMIWITLQIVEKDEHFKYMLLAN